MAEYGFPAVVSRLCQCANLRFVDVLAFDDAAARAARLHRNHHQMLLQEAERHFIYRVFNLYGPEILVVIVAGKSRHANSNRVLCPGDVVILPFGIVLEAENQAGKHLGVHLRELDRPYLLNHLPGAGGQPAAVPHLESGLYGYGDCPAGVVAADIRLVYPGAGKVEAGRYAFIRSHC